MMIMLTDSIEKQCHLTFSCLIYCPKKKKIGLRETWKNFDLALTVLPLSVTARQKFI